jgi:DNA-binding NtrC family response regulator
MRALKQVIAKIAPTDIPILLLGESGTGKEVVAAEIHRLSRQHSEPFVKLSCGALSPGSFEEWLRRNQNGDGARSSPGWGTVFLDQIGELDPASQSKLLNALPEGDEVPCRPYFGARLICAMNKNLEEEVRAGCFREDLYYRINGVCLRVPPLRDRKEDIPALVSFFLEKYAQLLGRAQPALSPPTMRVLLNYSWPGNIRELENALKKIVLLGEEGVGPADWEPSLPGSQPASEVAQGISLKDVTRAASRQAERKLILKVLAQTRWNRKRAAQELQISYKALLNKLKQIGLDNSPASQD